MLTSAGTYCQIKKAITFPGTQVKIDVWTYANNLFGDPNAAHRQIYLDGDLLWSLGLLWDQNYWLKVSVTLTPSAGSHELKLRVLSDYNNNNILNWVYWDDVEITKV